MTVQQACEYLMGQDEILILCHQSPDGDTLGSGFGLYYALRAMGKQAKVACSDPVPHQFSFLLPEQLPDFAPQCVVAVDIADTQLLGSKLSRWADQVDLCIDHHPSNRGYAQRTLLRAVSGERPMADSTWLGSRLPLVQAEPLEQAIPAKSSRMSRLSPSTPGKEKFAFPGRRRTGWPFSRASGTADSTP